MSIPTFNTVVPTSYWHQLDDGRVQCDLCPRVCKLHEGQRGFCFVRTRQHDQIVLTTYGRSITFASDSPFPLPKRTASQAFMHFSPCLLSHP